MVVLLCVEHRHMIMESGSRLKDTAVKINQVLFILLSFSIPGLSCSNSSFSSSLCFPFQLFCSTVCVLYDVFHILQFCSSPAIFPSILPSVVIFKRFCPDKFFLFFKFGSKFLFLFFYFIFFLFFFIFIICFVLSYTSSLVILSVQLFSAFFYSPMY